MPDLADFHFLRPGWLIALLPLLLLPRLLNHRQLKQSDWTRFCDPALLPYILIQAPTSNQTLIQKLLLLGGLLAVLALAGPTYEKLPAPAFRNLSALVIVLDLSRAMDATDLKPSRLERARYKIIDLLQRRKDGQSALLVYAGEAFTVTPLTDDAVTIIAQMSALTTGLLPVEGQRSELGLDQAVKLLRQAGINRGDVLLVTAGGLATLDTNRAGQLAKAGYAVSVLGVGTPDGAPIPLAGGGFYQNQRGEIVVARMDAESLSKLADQGKGMYHSITDDDRDIAALLDFFDRHTQAENNRQGSTQLDEWQELGPWLLLPLLFLAALSFRRGWLGIWLLVILVSQPDPASALEWQDLWQTPDQRAQDVLTHGKPEDAAKLFENPEWKATAEYQAGHYAESAEAWQGQDTARSHYNQGNALAKLGRYADALSAYERALQLTPADEDTRYNRDLVKKALEQQQSDQKQKKPDQKPDGKKDSDSSAKPDEAKSPPDKNESRENQPDEQSDAKQNQAGQENSSPAQTSPDKTSPQQARPSKEQAEESTEQQQQTATQEAARQEETRQADEQWLRRIPDDPGGLLKRKFYYQYQQRLQER